MELNTILILIATISCLSVPIGAFYVYKRTKNALNYILNDPFSFILTPNNIEKALDTVVNNEKYQKFLYVSGGLAANGAMQGTGIASQGKLTPKNLFMQILGGFLQGKMSQMGQNAQNTGNLAATVTDQATKALNPLD